VLDDARRCGSVGRAEGLVVQRSRSIQHRACSDGSACVPRRLPVRLLAGLLLLHLPLIARATVPEHRENTKLLVGVLVQQREIGALEIRTDGERYLIPLESFAEVSGCSVGFDERGVARLKTPLGVVNFYPEVDLEESEGTVYVRQQTIERKLATAVSFDRSRYALSFDLPWRPVDGSSTRTFEAEPLDPDATAPGASLSTLRTDLRYTELDEDGHFGSSTTIGGKLGPGYWRLRYDDDLGDHRSLRDYAWLYKQGRQLLLAGNQRVRVHPLLRSIEFTGAQMAWTNQSLDLFSQGPAPRELLSRRMQPTRTFEGYGPMAGMAELRINGTVVDRQAIGLDGRYRFLDVAIPARPDSRIEILLYDRHNRNVPVEIHEETPTASAFLLSEGALIHMGGAGGEGNFIQDQWDSREVSGIAGFYQTRYGLSDRATLEAAVQGTEDVTQFLGGLVTRLGPTFVMSLGLGASSEALGYSIDLEGLRPPWRLVVRSLASQEGFDPLYQENQHDHFVEVGRKINPKLDFSLIGHSRKDANADEDYLLPAAGWRPSAALWMRGRPDYNGDYRFDLGYRIRPRTRLNVNTISSRVFAQISHELGARYRLSGDSEFGDSRPSRQSVVLSGFSSARWNTSWMVGALVTDGEPGYLLGGRLELLPGVHARAQLESDALINEPGSPQQSRLLLNITADLGYSRGRFVPAAASAVRADRGGVAGVVRVEAPKGFPEYSLHNLPILLDGRRIGRTGNGGAFFIGALKPGVYRLELDRENLPIELVPERVALNAEVAAAAVTRLDFVVRPEFGLAGRVRDSAGTAVSGMEVELVAADGTVLQSASTDHFGLFRIDSVPIGVYTLRLAPGSAPAPGVVAPTRIVEIRDDFLFGQDLELSFVIEDASANRGAS
jgi:hypothetical protein